MVENISLKRFLFASEWKESSAGNHVLIEDEELIATVYKSKHSPTWQIVINHDGSGYFVVDEFYQDSEKAIERTEAIFDGAACTVNRAK